MTQSGGTAKQRELWGSLAEAWERNAEFVDRGSAPVKKWLIEHLDPQPGQTILELGAGPGDTGFEVASVLGDAGRLISTDIAAEMVEVARRRAEARGVDNAEFRVIDAQDIDLDDGSVDGILHRFGPMLLPDPDAGFAEARRVLAPGGRYAAAVFTTPDRNMWIGLVVMSLMQNGVQMPAEGNPMGPGGPFSLGDSDALRTQLLDAGFEHALVELIDMPFDFPDLGEGFDVLTQLGGPITLIVAALDPDERQRVKDTFIQTAEEYRSEGGYRLPGEALGLLAR